MLLRVVDRVEQIGTMAPTYMNVSGLMKRAANTKDLKGATEAEYEDDFKFVIGASYKTQFRLRESGSK